MDNVHAYPVFGESDEAAIQRAINSCVSRWCQHFQISVPSLQVDFIGAYQSPPIAPSIIVGLAQSRYHASFELEGSGELYDVLFRRSHAAALPLDDVDDGDMNHSPTANLIIRSLFMDLVNRFLGAEQSRQIDDFQGARSTTNMRNYACCSLTWGEHVISCYLPYVLLAKWRTVTEPTTKTIVSRQQALHDSDGVIVSCQVFLPSSRLSLAMLRSLEVGDVLSLDVQVDEKAELVIDKKHSGRGLYLAKSGNIKTAVVA